MALKGPSYAPLVRERSTAIDNMRTLQRDAVANANNWSITQLGVRLDILESYWQCFRQAQRQLMLEYSHLECVIDTMSQIEYEALELYANVKANMQQAKAELELAAPQLKPPRPSEIKVSIFSGKYTEWSAWWAEFKAKVLDTRLEPSDKITLLLGALAKEAPNCAGQAERLDALELDRIWSKLDRTYDNKYQQVYEHIAQIVHISSIQQPSADKLRSMIDTVDQHLRMLKRFDIETDHWGPMVCVILLNKLDMETRNQWESKDSLPPMPELAALFAFLEQRILAIRNVEQNARHAQQPSAATNVNASRPFKGGISTVKHRFHPNEMKPMDSANTSKDNAKSEPPSCPRCGSDTKHYLWHCGAFRALESTVQIDQLRKWGICEVCLQSKHKASECTKGNCPICKTGRHNSSICPQSKLAKKVNHVRRKRARSSVKNEAK